MLLRRSTVSSGTILGKIVQVQGNALNRVQLAPRWRPLADQRRWWRFDRRIFVHRGEGGETKILHRRFCQFLVFICGDLEAQYPGTLIESLCAS